MYLLNYLIVNIGNGSAELNQKNYLDTPVGLQREQPKTWTWDLPGLSKRRATRTSLGKRLSPQTGHTRLRSPERQYTQP